MSPRFKPSKKPAFTLIELLIVVAIIAILASIAVPNFLDAQVRSKVARSMSDMRTIAIALQCYTVDYNKGPMDSEWDGNYGAIYGNSWNFAVPVGYIKWPDPGSLWPQNTTGFDNDSKYRKMSQWEVAITTPVKYITQTPMDVFGQERGWLRGDGRADDPSSNYPLRRTTFVYVNYENYARAITKNGGYYDNGTLIKINGWQVNTSGGTNWNIMGSTAPVGKANSMAGAYFIYKIGGFRWGLFSPGPSMMGMRSQVAGRVPGSSATTPYIGMSGFPTYDPTNGTKSTGYMVRTDREVYKIGTTVYNWDNRFPGSPSSYDTDTGIAH